MEAKSKGAGTNLFPPCYRASLEKHEDDFLYAQLRKEANAPLSEVINLLTQCLAFEPGYPDARFLLGLTAAENKQFGFALSTLLQMKSVTPDQAYNYFSALAYCDLGLQSLTEAEANA